MDAISFVHILLSQFAHTKSVDISASKCVVLIINIQNRPVIHSINSAQNKDKNTVRLTKIAHLKHLMILFIFISLSIYCMSLTPVLTRLHLMDALIQATPTPQRSENTFYDACNKRRPVYGLYNADSENKFCRRAFVILAWLIRKVTSLW